MGHRKRQEGTTTPHMPFSAPVRPVQPPTGQPRILTPQRVGSCTKGVDTKTRGSRNARAQHNRRIPTPTRDAHRCNLPPMRPVPIPNDAIPPNARRLVISPPGGDLTNEHIAPVEALAYTDATGIPLLSVMLTTEPGDLEALTNGAHLWITFLGGTMTPWAVDVH